MTAGLVDVDAPASYAPALGAYLRTRSENALYQASLLSTRFVTGGVGPEEIIALHADAVRVETEALPYREQARASAAALEFLLEVMIAYGVQYQQHVENRLGERTREAEAAAALEREKAVLAEQADREKEQLLAMISHELRTPLAVVSGSTQLLQRMVRRGSLVPERLERSLGDIGKASDRMKRLTEDLLDASRGELPRLVVGQADLALLAARAVEWAQHAAAEKAVTLVDASGAASSPLPVLADADALMSVIGNLLSNAIRYTESGGRVELACGAEANEVWVAVRDTGVGMTPEVQARIFERFYRAPNARQSAAGLGIGLYLVSRLVDAHQGRIELATIPGEGSTFRVVLPLAAQSPTTPPSPN